jgi:hypothetical protein
MGSKPSSCSVSTTNLFPSEILQIIVSYAPLPVLHKCLTLNQEWNSYLINLIEQRHQRMINNMRNSTVYIIPNISCEDLMQEKKPFWKSSEYSSFTKLEYLSSVSRHFLYLQPDEMLLLCSVGSISRQIKYKQDAIMDQAEFFFDKPKYFRVTWLFESRNNSVVKFVYHFRIDETQVYNRS